MPVVTPVSTRSLERSKPAPGAFVEAVNARTDALLYFLLNVGDGDTQLLVLPPDTNDGHRRVVIVDVATRGKLPALLDELAAAEILTQPPGSPGQIRLLVATHPHLDHIGGLGDLLDRYNGAQGGIDQFWDPGYYFPSPPFVNVMRRLEVSSWLRRLQPSSGTTLYLDQVKITVVGPGVGLRTRFDTYGVTVNDASLTLMVEYPATSVYSQRAADDEGRLNRRSIRSRTRRLLLGGDAQFTSWAQATIDFPDLAQANRALANELREARGRDYLSADVFKLSHHASKHGIHLELLERVQAPVALISAVAGGGSYNFPHALAMDAAREARYAITSRTGAAAKYPTDHDLGIHLTGATLSGAGGRPLGTIGMVIPPAGRMRMFRFMDGPRDNVSLAAAREVTPSKLPQR